MPRKFEPRIPATWLAAAVVLLASADTAAGATPSLAIVGPSTVEVTFTKHDGYESAPVAVTVRNKTGSEGQVVASFLAAGTSGLPVTAVAPPPKPPETLMLVATDTAPKLKKEELGAIVLELRRPVGSKLASGLIILSVADSAAAAGTVSVSEAATPQTAVGFEQKDVTIVATAWLGPVARTCRRIADSPLMPHFARLHCPGQHYSDTSTVVKAGGVIKRSTTLGSDGGLVLTVTLAPTHAEPQSATSGTPTPGPAQTTAAATTTAATTAGSLPDASIKVSKIPGPGKYSGALAIDPTQKDPKSIAITVHAQDALIWPMLVVLLGAAFGGLLNRFYDVRWRGRRLLRATLDEAVAPYLKEREKPDVIRPQRFYLDDLLKPGGPDEQFARSLPGRGPKPDELVPLLYWRTDDCNSSEAIVDLATEMKATTDRFARWNQLNIAFKTLRDTSNRLDQDTSNRLGQRLLVRRDSERLLDLAEDEPADDKEAAARVARMVGHARLVAIYRAVRKRFFERSPEWRKTHPDVNPTKLYAAAPTIDGRTPEQATTLRLDLLRAYRLLATDPLPDQPESDTASFENLRILYLRYAVEATGSAGELQTVEPAIPGLGRVPPSIRKVPTRYESAEQLRRVVREWDWAVFWTLAVLTGLVVLLPLYVGKDFGSVPDYLLLFATGATAPTIVSWALSPLGRSTKATPSPAAGGASGS